MGLPRIGGETPIVKAFTFTAESPAGTSVSTPVLPGELFVLQGAADAASNGYKLEVATAGDDTGTHIIAMALERSDDAAKAIGVIVLTGNCTQIRRLKYTGGAPTLGHSVEISAANPRKVVDHAAAYGLGLILAVDTANEEVEVLI
jgi:hypothetical protein